MSSDHARPTARRRARPAAFSLLLAVLAGVTGLPASASAAPAGTVEGEQLTPDKGVIASTYRDTNASGGAVFGLWSSGAASTTVSTPALGSLAVRAKADLCNGAPTLELWVDGELVLSTPVGSTSWATYGVNGSWPAGSHRIGVAFPNDARTSGCDRNLQVDTLGLDTATVGGYPQALPPARPQPTATRSPRCRSSSTRSPPPARRRTRPGPATRPPPGCST